MTERLLVGGRLRVVFQPIVDLETGERIGYEALGRVRSARTHELVSVRPYLEVASREGWLLMLDRALRRIAVDAIATHPQARQLRWFLNFDTRAMDDAAYTPGFTRRLLGQHGLASARVVAELGSRDPNLDARRFGQFIESAPPGLEVSLDDLGVGHSSLRLVAALEPSMMKLDTTVITGISREPARAAMIGALVRFGEQGHVAVMAEGIEDVADLRALRSEGVRYGQGHLLGRPGPLVAEPTVPAESPVVLPPRHVLADGPTP